MRKVSLFIPSLDGGGAERVVVNLANELADRGWAVDLVLSSARGPYLGDVASEVRVVDLANRRLRHCLPKLVRYLRHERPEAVLSTLTYANLLAIVARMIAGVSFRLVICEANTLSANAATASLKKRVMPWLTRRLYKKADAIVAYSDGVANDLAALTGVGREQMKVIYNPVVNQQMLEKSEEAVHHPWFVKGHSTPVLLSVGRLVEQKDYPTLLQALVLIRKEIAAKLLILGDGPDRSSLEAMIARLELQDHVAMPGFVENPYKYMKNAQAFVLSSRWEGFGNVLAEALAVGVPIVATDCPSGPGEILEQGKWGRLVPVGDAQALSKAVLQVLTEGGVDGRQRVRQFTTARAADRYIDVLRCGDTPG